ncbi:hypothetical protein FH972_006048 [Carpinus fangiana]|uniref:Uncharacterized protein n=1 Tax=Carpinus fangiana TaxID=176857 RepID=A0A5N6QTH0_9ROSI|nr:hypothetical protein FH972_006048 [Carpinus fangiana]
MLGIVIPAFVVTARNDGVDKSFCRRFEWTLVMRIPRTSFSVNTREGRFGYAGTKTFASVNRERRQRRMRRCPLLTPAKLLLPASSVNADEGFSAGVLC